MRDFRTPWMVGQERCDVLVEKGRSVDVCKGLRKLWMLALSCFLLAGGCTGCSQAKGRLLMCA